MSQTPLPAMKNRPVDSAWILLCGLFTQVFNPLFVIWPAVFVCFGYILTLLMPMQIAHWRTLLWFSLLLSLAGLLLRFRGMTPLGPPVESGGGSTPLGPPVGSGGGIDCSLGFHWRALLPLLPLLVFLPMFQAELASPTLQIMNHGDMHVGYVHELLYRTTPAENIFVPGYPANFYWLYHALLAALVKATGWAPPLAASLLTIIAICSSFYWLARVLVGLGLAKRRSLYLGLLIVLVYCAVNITGVLTLLGTLLDGTYQSNSIRIMLLPGADRRLHSVMGKVMNFTSTAIGIMCFIASLHICLRFLRGKLDRLDTVVLSACVALCLAVRQTAVLYIVLVLLGGGATVGLSLLFDRSARGLPPLQLVKATIRRLHPRFVAIWLGSSAFLTLPLLHYYAKFSEANGVGFSIRLFDAANISMLGAALLAFLPLFTLQTPFALRDRSWINLFIPFSAWLGLLLTAVLLLPNGDQHKTVFYVSILVALSALLALQRLARTWDRGRIQPLRLFTLCLIALAFAKVMVVKNYYDVRARELEFVYENSHITYLDGYIDGERMPAYAWIREHTPVDAIVVLPLTVHRYEHMLHERQVYARKSQYWFTNGIPAYGARASRLWQLFDEETADQTYREILDDMLDELPGRAFYAVVVDSEVAGEVMARRGAEAVFMDESGAHVYLLNP